MKIRNSGSSAPSAPVADVEVKKEESKIDPSTVISTKVSSDRKINVSKQLPRVAFGVAFAVAGALIAVALLYSSVASVPLLIAGGSLAGVALLGAGGYEMQNLIKSKVIR